MPGLFISFEGGEGVGKTTQIRRLEAALRKRGHQTLCTREPGGSEGAEAIRGLLVTGETDRWDVVSEILLLNAARRDHVEQIIRPALKVGQVVLCDRYVDSTRVYQGMVKGCDAGLVEMLHQGCIGLDPDVTFLLDMPASEGLGRAGGRESAGAEDRFERYGQSFHDALRQAFLTLAGAEPSRIVVIDASGPEEEVHARIWQGLRTRMGDRLP